MAWKGFWRIPKNHSGSLAKKRLQVVLVTDKADCSPELIDRMKDDMVRVISKYMTIDRDGIEFKIVNSRPGAALYAAFPILELPNKGKC
ncbi:MAG: cell division topological specificity factor MinE [Lachnospiraceae bacterium]|nr:cell division topological specificity factor MinE [Lachnospiraceae bacterium]